VDASQGPECSRARAKRKSPAGLSRAGSSTPEHSFSSAPPRCHTEGFEPEL